MSQLITPQLIRAVLPSHTHPTVVSQKLQDAAEKYGITTPLRVAHFIGQLAHESNLMPIEENLNYSAKALCRAWPNRFAPGTPLTQRCTYNPEGLANYVYGGRMGNIAPGDGYKFRGRGFIQITGRENYDVHGKRIGYDLVSNPELVLQFGVAALVAASFWNANGLNALADRDDLLSITKRINGGTNGIDDRRIKTARAKKFLGIRTL